MGGIWRKKAVTAGLISLIALAFNINYSFAQDDKFRFISSGDPYNGDSDVPGICNQIRAMPGDEPPIFIIPGDVGKDSDLKSNMGTLYDNGFPVRGNHDSGGASWTSDKLKARVTAIGGKNYSTLSSAKGLVYSFDYKNSHFVGLDVPGDFSKNPLSSTELNWLDDDLTAAEGRGLAHAFIWTHPPLISHGKHSTSHPPKNVILITNKHKIVSAWFGGHSHVFAWTHLKKSRAPDITAEFESFNSGPMGEDSLGSLTGDYDAGVDGKHGFATIDVDGNTFKVSWYDKGNTSSKWSKTFTNSDWSVGNKLGDVNADGKISSYDALLAARHAASRITLTPEQRVRADVNEDTHVTHADADMIAQYVVGLIDKFGLEIVATPKFSPGGGTYSSAQSVTISTTTSGAVIHYTTDGSEPTQSSSTYTAPITVSATKTIKARAWKTGMNPSNIASATYTITVDSPATVATPAFSPAGGTYSSAQSVTISTSTSGDTIHYTTNGSEPTQSSTTYTSPITIAATKTIKAKAWKTGMNPSNIASATYTIPHAGTCSSCHNGTIARGKPSGHPSTSKDCGYCHSTSGW